MLDALPTDDRHQQITIYLGSVFGDSVHVKRIESLSGATLGVTKSASLAVWTIGPALAQARELTTKHAIKQADRLLSNSAIDV